MHRRPSTNAELRRRAEQMLGPRAPEQSQVDYDIALLQMEIKLQQAQLVISQEELDHAREKFKHLYEHTPIGYATLDATGVIIDVNQKLCEALARERDDLYGAPFATLLGELDAARMLRLLHDTEPGTPVDVEVELVRSDGSVVPARLEIVSTDEGGFRIAIGPR
ncbi:MAG TPA: PAS domain-containing protein [Kofleriaceae bacterium]